MNIKTDSVTAENTGKKTLSFFCINKPRVSYIFHFFAFIIKLILFIKARRVFVSLSYLAFAFFFSMLEELVCSLGEGLHEAGISCLALDEVHIICCGSLAVK